MSQTVPESESLLRDDIFAGYSAPAGRYDEMRSADGKTRAHWEQFAAALNRSGSAEFARRWDQAQRWVHENGITYDLYGGPNERPRPWQLDALPLLLSTAEWQNLSGALQQRAQLLNLILADLFGPQDLVRQGLLPAELIYKHPGFLRPCQNQPVPDDCYLHFYAADLARSPDGRWWVLADRTEAPSGVGYALENRIVISRMLPSVIHDCKVERLAQFFIGLRESLYRLAPRFRENPRIVLLTQGPSSPNYFEDSYLARYLGFTLVEGGDLTVRDNRVYLKTLGGLLLVEVILRRVHDEDCDPLELKGNSGLGVAGLLQAVRSGNVVVANTIGSGIIESPVFMAYLPRLCKELLGEEIKLPSVATWWCGNPESCRYVLENLPRLVLKPAFRRNWHDASISEFISQNAFDALKAAILKRPADFVAQEHVQRSSIPVWKSDHVDPWHVAVRSYLVASEGSYTAMTGGLCRVSPNAGQLDFSIQAGDRSKDIWVVSPTPVPAVSLLQQAGQRVELRRTGAELPSRVADNLYWLGRNLERAEGSARLLRTILARLTSESAADTIPELPILLRALTLLGQLEPGFVLDDLKVPLPTIEEAIPTTVFDATESMSLQSTLNVIQRGAAVVRDRISIDSWRTLNRIIQEFQLRTPVEQLELSDLLTMLNRLVINLSSFSGLVMESMTRTLAWRFLDIGRRLERSQHTLNLIYSGMVNVNDNEPAVLDALLEVADSSMTYRSRYLANLQLIPALDLLLTDETNPRSIAFQLVALYQHMDELPRHESQPLLSLEQRLTLAALNSIRLAEIQSLGEVQRGGERQHLARLLNSLSGKFPKLSDAITNRFLVHAVASRQLSDLFPGVRR